MNIANELSKRGHQCFQIQFELGDLLVPSNHVKTIFAPWHVSKEEYPISNEKLLSMQIYNITFTERMLRSTISVKELQMYKRYMNFIDKYIEQQQIEVLCMFNGYHWIEQVSMYIAEKRGLKTYFFEDGLFRPFTVTVDPHGINANSSVPGTTSFYDSLQIDKSRLSAHLFTPENKELTMTKENLLKVAVLKGVSLLGGILKFTPKLYVHTTFWQSIKYIIFKYRFRYKKEDEVNLTNEYIFLPFQVSRDTQIFYNSPHIKSMDQLLNIAVQAVKEINIELNRDIKIIVKEHPEDMSRNNYNQLKKRYEDEKNVVFVQKFNTKKLIRKALLILTINSTVGIEALAQDKKVVTLGNALYNIDGVSFHCEHPAQLKTVLIDAMNRQHNHERVEKFIYYLRFFYQVEGTINGTNDITAVNIANKLEEGCESH